MHKQPHDMSKHNINNVNPQSTIPLHECYFKVTVLPYFCFHTSKISKEIKISAANVSTCKIFVCKIYPFPWNYVFASFKLFSELQNVMQCYPTHMCASYAGLSKLIKPCVIPVIMSNEHNISA